MTKRMVGLAIASALVGTAIGWYWQRADAPSSSVARSDAKPSAPTSAGWHAQGPSPFASIASSLHRESKHAQLSQFIALGTPSAAFDAYGVIAECVGARKVEQFAMTQKAAGMDPHLAQQVASGELAKRTAQACGDLSPQDIAGRLALLEKAAAAGVPMAAVYLTSEGPWGDESALYTRPKDPLVLEWRQRMAELISLSAAKGDLVALQSLASQYSTGAGVIGQVDPRKALMYQTAFNIIYEEQNKKAPPAKDLEVKRLASRLSKDQAASAMAEGKQLAMAAMGRTQP